MLNKQRLRNGIVPVSSRNPFSLLPSYQVGSLLCKHFYCLFFFVLIDFCLISSPIYHTKLLRFHCFRSREADTSGVLSVCVNLMCLPTILPQHGRFFCRFEFFFLVRAVFTWQSSKNGNAPVNSEHTPHPCNVTYVRRRHIRTTTTALKLMMTRMRGKKYATKHK